MNSVKETNMANMQVKARCHLFDQVEIKTVGFTIEYGLQFYVVHHPFDLASNVFLGSKIGMDFNKKFTKMCWNLST